VTRTKKLIAVGTLALGIAAATTGPALASRHTTSPPAGHQVSMGAEDLRPVTAAPDDSRHTT
jgi:hypothetical protein